MKKTAYIHIGLPKTGTTAIQSTLHRFFKEGKLDRFDMQFHYWDTWSPLSDFRVTGDKEYFIEQIHKNIQKHSRLGEKNVIFSNESLVSLFRNNTWGFYYDILPALAEAFKDYDAKVIVYLRRQDLFIESLINQHAKIVYNTQYDNSFFSYKELINKCLENFMGGVILRKYERENLYKNDAVTDFLHAVGLDELIDDYIENKGKTINSSLSPRAFLMAMADNKQYLLSEAGIKARLEELENKYKSGFISRKKYAFWVDCCLWGRNDSSSLSWIKRAELLKGVTPNFAMGGSSYGFFSPEERAEIMSKYEEDNAAVAREYFGQEDGKLFNDKVPKNIIDMNSEPSATDIVQTFMPIIVNLTERCERLEQLVLKKKKYKIRKKLKGFSKLFAFLHKK